MRLADDEGKVMADPDALKSVATSLDLCRAPQHLLRHLGLHGRVAADATCSWKAARKIVYRQDLESQFMIMPRWLCKKPVLVLVVIQY